jgi:hypothetical protein
MGNGVTKSDGDKDVEVWGGISDGVLPDAGVFIGDTIVVLDTSS